MSETHTNTHKRISSNQLDFNATSHNTINPSSLLAKEWGETLKKLEKRGAPKEIRDNLGVYYNHFDKDFTKNLITHVESYMSDYYFRSEFVGFEKLEERNNPNHPLIYISNHSGMAFPWDGMIFTAELFRRFGFSKDTLRPLAAPILSKSALMNPFLTYNLWKKIGCVDATMLNFETMMNCNNHNVFIYPEGLKGIGKGFNKKYQLQRMSTSFIRMALKYQTDIVPFATVNAEYVDPHTYSFKWINKISSRIGIPFLPIGFITTLIPIFPWLFYTSFPAKLTYVKGERISLHKLIDKPYEEVTQDEIYELRDKVRAEFQQLLDDSVAKYGQKPYQLKELLHTNKKRNKNVRFFPYATPIGWPMLFNEFDRRYRKWRNGKKKRPFSFKLRRRDFVRVLFHNPSVVAYFIPILGWIPLAILGYKKPKGEK